MYCICTKVLATSAYLYILSNRIKAFTPKIAIITMGATILTNDIINAGDLCASGRRG